ncbi:hypothetical protein LV780_19745 (plasmid) [Cereibacter azotoformans]|uniref:hypothetical protein n=1 Tax=Cereibacter azotoformans TaxID=43057 RepID=UPI000E35F679|nr:hypothetical protein [Cereibacter azotoformans]AXQ96005.1 hypothetical protein D0Z66_19815 [Cereibacter sphaeroides]UIJ33074.1 hypothetical protein LV780_19745 [Cereibacter azotoformans]
MLLLRHFSSSIRLESLPQGGPLCWGQATEAALWCFLAPRPGWQTFVLAEGAGLVFTSAAGCQVLGRLVPEFASLGIATAADGTNRLAVASPATLLTHDGAGHQLKINKALAGDTASLLFQTGWSGQAEMGLATRMTSP